MCTYVQIQDCAALDISFILLKGGGGEVQLNLVSRAQFEDFSNCPMKSFGSPHKQ